METIFGGKIIMSKNIVICSDGTGNTTIKGRGTNVFKLYEATDTNLYPSNSSLKLQIAFYDDGIGTGRLRMLRILAGITGWGLGRNIRKLYGELARTYEFGDDIYLFGFSRGAFTVRMLARMIDTYGILKLQDNLPIDKDLFDTAVKTIYKKFLNRDCRPTKAKYSFHKNVRIKFIGVWDTVDAVGLPSIIGNSINRCRRFKVTDCDVLGNVAHVCHALAIDEKRAAFEPLLWNERNCKNSEGHIEQVWFAGAHANVGGGYPRQGMSLVAIDWMMSRAEKDGLRFISTQRTDYKDRQNINDRLYDSRSGVKILYMWKPRDIGQICENNGAKPRIHISVFERLAFRPDGYAPLNIPNSFSVVSTYDSQKAIADKCTENKIVNYNCEEHILKTSSYKIAIFASFMSYFLIIITMLSGLLAVVGTVGWFIGWWTVATDSSLFKWFLYVESGLIGITLSFASFSDIGLEHASAKFWVERQSELQKIFGLHPKG